MQNIDLICVGKLNAKYFAEGVTLLEIAPGIDLQTQILDQMEFMPKIAVDLKLMDERIFHEELMGLAND